jgi:hypothetical protein
MHTSAIRAAFCLKLATHLILLPGSTVIAGRQETFVLDKFLAQTTRLTKAEIDSVHNGKAVAKALDTSIPDEVFVTGIVYVEAAPESYLKFASDIDALRKLPGYLAVQRFSNPPKLSDLSEFTIDSADLKDLKNCKPGDCEVQLPSEAMAQFQKSVNWSAPDAANQANRLARQMTLDALLAYEKGGNAALGAYRDKDHPTRIDETFRSLLARLTDLPVYLPELHRILQDYPAVELKNSTSEFYWEKVDFGLKPTLRMVQQIIYRGGTPSDPTYGIALKQLYASHYFQGALDLTVCLRDSTRPNQKGFYLLTVKGSRQAGLTGLKGSIVRSTAVSKTRSSLENTLKAIKQKLEAAGRQ